MNESTDQKGQNPRKQEHIPQFLPKELLETPPTERLQEAQKEKRSAKGKFLEHRILQKYSHEDQVLRRVCPRHEQRSSLHSSQGWYKKRVIFPLKLRATHSHFAIF